MRRAAIQIATGITLLVLQAGPAAANNSRGPIPQPIKDRMAAAKQAVFPPSRTIRPPAHNRLRVAAIQFGSRNLDRDDRRSSQQVLTGLIRRAAANGAKVIVTPELALHDKAERDPVVGTNVLNSASYRRDGVIGSMGRLARSLGVKIVFHISTRGKALPPIGEAKVRQEHWAFRLDTRKLHPDEATKVRKIRQLVLDDARKPQYERFDAALAVDERGKVVANHHKFHSEWTHGIVGTSLKNSCFMTPAGKIGILVCADGQEAIKKMPKNPRNPNKKLLKEFIDQKDLAAIAYPTMWMAKGPGNLWRWKSTNQQSILAQVTKSYVIASNNNDAAGPGGGVYKPDGTPVESSINSKAEIHYGDLPFLRQQPQQPRP
jgi:predicted amidohydrolase